MPPAKIQEFSMGAEGRLGNISTQRFPGEKKKTFSQFF